MDINHKCYIGILYHLDYQELATVEDVIDHIHEQKEFNDYAEKIGYPKKVHVWTMKEYTDKRRSTDLERFDYCPRCGKKINWKMIKDDA